MLPVILAVISAILAEIVFEDRYPLQVSGGWVWMARGIHVVSFFILSGIVVALIHSYAF